MTLSILLTLMGLDQKPSEAIVNLWLDCLLDDDKIIRDRAFQPVLGKAQDSFHFGVVFWRQLRCARGGYRSGLVPGGDFEALDYQE